MVCTCMYVFVDRLCHVTGCVSFFVHLHVGLLGYSFVCMFVGLFVFVLYFV